MSPRDPLLTLLTIYDLHTAPVGHLGDAARWQHHPAVATLKWVLEEQLVAHLDGADFQASVNTDDAIGAIRALARIDQVPEVYEWVAEEASLEDLVEFLALEGGPDGGFDDLVAACQLGLAGVAKVELARNYWDEMGNGNLGAVHTELHRRLVDALAIPRVPRGEQPTEALARAALGGLLATNRHLQPELVGALGLIELQAGPRCRQVVAGLRRLHAPEEAQIGRAHV